MSDLLKYLSLRGFRMSFGAIFCATVLSVVQPVAMESKDMPVTKVYITCAAKGADAAALCASAIHALETELTGSHPLRDPLNVNTSRPQVIRGSAPMPLAQDAVSIDLKLTQNNLGLVAIMSITAPQAQPLVLEQSLTVMDRQTPIGLGRLEAFLGRFIERSVAKYTKL
jgi:hypothetical protein